MNKLNRQFEAFKKTAYNTIGKELKSEKRVGTVTINDIEAERNIKYSKEIQEWEDKIDKVTEELDTFSNIVNALEQKKDAIVECARNLRRFSPEGVTVYDESGDYASLPRTSRSPKEPLPKIIPSERKGIENEKT